MTSDPSPQHTPRCSSWQCLLSALAAVFFALLSTPLALGGLWLWTNHGLTRARPFFMLFGITITTTIILALSAYVAARRDRGRPLSWTPWLGRLLHPVVLLLLIPPVLALGARLAQTNSPLWLFFPLLHVLAVGLPLLGFLRIGLHGLPSTGPSRLLGALSVGMVIAPLLIMTFEIIALVLGVLSIGALITLNPGGQQAIGEISRRLMYVPSLRIAQRILAPYLRQPLVLYGVLVSATLVVALIEEAIKPLAVWRLVGERAPKPVEGLVLGALSGAGFAYYETLTIALGPAPWLSVVISRIGTSLLHITTAALTGWGMALAWRERRYLRLGLAYLTAVLWHTLWNTLTLAAAVASLPDMPAWLQPFKIISPPGLMLLTGGLLLWWLHSRRTLKQICYNEPPSPIQTEGTEFDGMVEISD